MAGEGTWLVGAFVKLSDCLIPCTAALIECFCAVLESSLSCYS